LSLEQNLKDVLNKIKKEKEKSSFKQDVQLIAVTKTRPISIIKECCNLGVRNIGENRVQEAAEKFIHFDDFEKTKKRFIGHLQTNKVNKCLNLFDTIDSVDSYRLASKIDTSARNKNIKIECLLEINTSGEKQKHGFKPEINKELLSCFDLKNLNITGLMTVGPNTQDKNKIRKSFSLLREIKESINENISTNVLTELSMGMSGDYDVGIQEGSTMVRVGTGLFGKREY
jgi:pyridoxal phosphate enzyme (YggS family)